MLRRPPANAKAARSLQHGGVRTRSSQSLARLRRLAARLARSLVPWLPLLAKRPYMARQFDYNVVADYPHDPAAFTQGLVVHNGTLYESTGGDGRSALRRVELTTGRVLAERRLDPVQWGEGLAVVGARLIQLTWQAGIAHVYDVDTLEPVGFFEYETEGWGLAYDGRQLIMSDGSANLYFRDPVTFKELRRTRVSDGGRRVKLLNDLQYINGHVYANVWQTARIARIDPASGLVTGWLDLGELVERVQRSALAPIDVLNGIAYDSAGGRVFITGKNWPRLFQIESPFFDSRKFP